MDVHSVACFNYDLFYWCTMRTQWVSFVIMFYNSWVFDFHFKYNIEFCIAWWQFCTYYDKTSTTCEHKRDKGTVLLLGMHMITTLTLTYLYLNYHFCTFATHAIIIKKLCPRVIMCLFFSVLWISYHELIIEKLWQRCFTSSTISIS